MSTINVTKTHVGVIIAFGVLFLFGMMYLNRRISALEEGSDTSEAAKAPVKAAETPSKSEAQS